MVEKDEALDARFLEVAQLRQRVSRAEGAVNEVLRLERDARQSGGLISPDEVRAAVERGRR